MLAGRFNLAGRFIRAQNQADRPGGSIIDTMMNLSILFWASQESRDPRWDFRVKDFSGEPRDTSAASIAASGLLEIAAQLPPEEGRVYQIAAEKIIRSLSERYSTFDRDDQEGILLAGTGHKPAGRDINVSLIFGDYYYVEALAKLNGWKNRIY